MTTIRPEFSVRPKYDPVCLVPEPTKTIGILHENEEERSVPGDRLEIKLPRLFGVENYISLAGYVLRKCTGGSDVRGQKRHFDALKLPVLSDLHTKFFCPGPVGSSADEPMMIDDP
ncbi:hypothetical protein VKT23_018380 [Stygiomarasmius scandens]|uniref:Uncharacterized protein n=1 Tax=Marasmiellus scandens TaxID=2682957 RepID=A0ABR1IRY4_9AGAR